MRPVLAAGSGLVRQPTRATLRRVGSILVEVLRQKTSASRRSTRGWRADPIAQSLRASSEDGRAEHEVHDNEDGEDRGGTA